MWIVEGRTPFFVTSSNSESPTAYESFRTSISYLWGNIAAIDCLNIPENEHESATRQNFKLCFAGMSCLPKLSILFVFTRRSKLLAIFVILSARSTAFRKTTKENAIFCATIGSMRRRPESCHTSCASQLWHSR